MDELRGVAQMLSSLGYGGICKRDFDMIAVMPGHGDPCSDGPRLALDKAASCR